MNLNKIYKLCERYNFTKLDICTKEEAIQIFICHIKSISKSKYFSTKNELELNEIEIKTLFEYLDRLLIDNIPIQYIIGEVKVYNETYIVNDSVLIPRQDTEILIEKAVAYIDKYNLKTGLDLCCGSGVIGISACNNSNIETMHFVDISKEALDVTKENILKNSVIKKTHCINSNLFENIMTLDTKYDIIMSNPPYIPTNDIQSLSMYVKNEPIIALDGGESGLVFYEKIVDEARYYLNDNGYIMFEIGYDQMDSLIRIFSKYKEYEILEKVKDLNSNDRVIICRFHKI